MGKFDDIRPYEGIEIRQAFSDLLADRQFQLVLKGFAPWLPKSLRNGLLKASFIGIKTPLDFQKRFMKPVVKMIMRRHTDGCTFEGGENSKAPHTFISNHRDIVLDSALLDVLLIDHHYPTTVEIGIGDNLLIYPWIKRLVRMNKAFIVRRSLSVHEMLRSSQLMSEYIHHAVNDKKENIWIAQREGRAKDSSDNTQEGVMKMLAMGGGLRQLDIVPLTISYEYDPCDYLKAQEFQQKRDNPAHKKSRQDDLDNMRTGIFGRKGRVTYRCARPLNTWIGELDGLPRHDFYKELCRRIDRELHRNYELYPVNYIAHDMQNGSHEYASHYTEKDVEGFNSYIDGQIAKISLPQRDDDFLRERMLTMYANPVKNFINAQ